jgi:hypothetical protein
VDAGFVVARGRQGILGRRRAWSACKWGQRVRQCIIVIASRGFPSRPLEVGNLSREGSWKGQGYFPHVCPNGPVGIPSDLACVYSNQGKGRDPPQPVGAKQALNGFREFKIYLEVLGCPLNPNAF